MEKMRIVSLSGAALLLMGLVTAGYAEEIKGKVKSVSKHSRTLSLEVEKKGVVVVKFDNDTKFKNAASANDIIVDEVVSADVIKVGAENRAKNITKVIASLPAGVTRVSAAELQELLKKGGERFQLIDSRPAGKYNESHLPKAVSIPLPELEKGGEKLLPADRGTTLVFYCGGLSCGLSPKSASIAVKLGFTDVRMYPEGEPGWKKLEYPTEAALPLVKNGNIVLIDLRSPEQVAEGHIPRAVNIPSAKLSGAEKQFPEFKGAPIVFYGGGEKELAAALEQMRDWGYTNATVFPGGIKAWQAAGNKVTAGAAPATISYVRKLTEGEVAINEFEAIVAGGGQTIIDARSAEEFAKGHFPGAINIPSEEMATRYGEIPVGKPAVVHCANGTRAEMAYDILKDKGGKIRYLKASVEFGPAGKAVIME